MKGAVQDCTDSFDDGKAATGRVIHRDLQMELDRTCCADRREDSSSAAMCYRADG